MKSARIVMINAKTQRLFSLAGKVAYGDWDEQEARDRARGTEPV